ncbi:MAG: D-2-hydroxyacid dehydrogenase [Planctomycetota bacterium]|nr:D-2-hydroxyacid dehydrogenase [Planctomycetota bacterium]
MHLLHDAPLPDESLAAIRRVISDLRVTAFSGRPERKWLETADVIFTEEANFDPAEAPRLLWVQTNTASVAGLCERPIMNGSVPICTAGGSLSTAVAECAIGSLLALTRHIKRAAEWQRDTRWPSEYTPWAGTELYGLTMGIVGYGSVGRQIARVAQAFGMTILACKRNPDVRTDDSYLLPGTGDPEGNIPEVIYGVDRLREMLALSNVVVSTLPATPYTDKLIGADEFASLPRPAWLVSIGRGTVIDEQALVQALHEHQIAGAALDVFAEEPLPASSPLWKMENVMITPHIGSFTTSYNRHAADVLIENLRRHASGLPLVNMIDKQLLY